MGQSAPAMVQTCGHYGELGAWIDLHCPFSKRKTNRNCTLEIQCNKVSFMNRKKKSNVNRSPWRRHWVLMVLLHKLYASYVPNSYSLLYQKCLIALHIDCIIHSFLIVCQCLKKHQQNHSQLIKVSTQINESETLWFGPWEQKQAHRSPEENVLLAKNIYDISPVRFQKFWLRNIICRLLLSSLPSKSCLSAITT